MFTTLAVAFMRIVTGLGPHEKRMIPPARTAATTAADVQLAGVPRPTMRLGVRGVDRAAGGRHGHRSGTAGAASAVDWTHAAMIKQTAAGEHE